MTSTSSMSMSNSNGDSMLKLCMPHNAIITEYATAQKGDVDE